MLQHLVDRMIDQASERNPGASYNILVSAAAPADQGGMEDMTVYRSCRVFQTRLVPKYTVVLAPSPDNLRHHDLVEYQGGFLNGGVTQITIRRRPHLVAPAPKTSPETTQPSKGETKG